MNTRRRFNFYKTSNTTLPMLYWHLADSKTISRDHVQLAVNIFFIKFFADSSKKLFENLIYRWSNFAITVSVNLLMPGVHQETRKT